MVRLMAALKSWISAVNGASVVRFFPVLCVLALCACSAPTTSPSPVVSQIPPTPSATFFLPTPQTQFMECVVAALPEVETTATPYYPQPREGDWTLGAADAPVTFLIYNDFNCFSCADFAAVYRPLQEEFAQDLRIVYRFLPTEFLAKAPLAAQAAQAAGLQGKFWEMHDLLFDQQAVWMPFTKEEFVTWLDGQMAALGLDGTQFALDLESAAVIQRVQADTEDAARLNIPPAPFLVINDRAYSGPSDLKSLTKIINLSLLPRRQFHECPPVVIDTSREYIATLHTEKGDIVLQLYADKAPAAVNSFVFLAQQGWYDGVTFHEVIPGAYALSGDPSATGLGNPGYIFTENPDLSLRFDRPGVVALFNSSPNSNGSMFFITYTASEGFSAAYPIFGQVIQGMDVLESLTPRNPNSTEFPPSGDKILSISIEER
jgi:cyclophilin family peptidyl-prolyl cis-trans isomerase/protein-disulfide isomerase